MLKRIPISFLFAFLFAFTLSACGKFKPDTSADGFKARAQTQAQGDLHVTAAALGGKESHEYFGEKLAKKGVQPVWLKIQNDSKKPYWLFPISVDPDYFSPAEAAYRSTRWKSKTEKQLMIHFFDTQQIPFYIPTGKTVEGFLYTNRDIGSKEVSVDLVGHQDLKRMNFVLPVPGLTTDYQMVDFDTLYRPDEIRSVGLVELRRALEEMPCCTNDKRGKKEGQGDAVNLVFIGHLEDMITTFVRRGWKETAAGSKGSSMSMVKHLFFGGAYENAPMSKLWLFGRSQDISFQKPRPTIRQRNHLRLWMTNLRYEEKPVWVGTISRDIGLRPTMHAAFFITHKIDSDIDEARDYVLQDMMYSESIGLFGFVKGVGAAPYDDPHYNLTGDTWYTDGMRAVVIVAKYPTPILKTKNLNWEATTNQYNLFK